VFGEEQAKYIVNRINFGTESYELKYIGGIKTAADITNNS
jgi:hypothetical protein